MYLDCIGKRIAENGTEMVTPKLNYAATYYLFNSNKMFCAKYRTDRTKFGDFPEFTNILPQQHCAQGCWQRRQRPGSQWGRIPWDPQRCPRTGQVLGTPQMAPRSMQRQPPTRSSPRRASRREHRRCGRRPRAARSPVRRCRGRGRP